MVSSLTLHNLSYTYPGQPAPALEGVSLELVPGQMCGLLGPNGAGKTTLLRLVSGFLSPGSGEVQLGGETLDRSALSRIGLLIENPGVYKQLTAREFLDFFCEAFQVSDPAQRVSALCETFGFSELEERCGRLSLGNRQKLHLVRSLLHRPQLVLWDEPFNYLDPPSREQAERELVRYLGEEGAMALVATHQLEMAENFISHVCMLQEGRVRYQGSVQGNVQVTLRLVKPEGERARQTLRDWNGQLTLQSDEELLMEVKDPRKEVPPVLDQLHQAGIAVWEVTHENRTRLKSLYQRYLGDFHES